MSEKYTKLLWRKEEIDGKAVLVDIFELLSMCSLMNDMALHELKRTSNSKSARIASDAIRPMCTIGQSVTMEDAQKLSNKSLCFSEHDSEEQRCAYLLRSQAFLQCNQYEKALADIELASQNTHSLNYSRSLAEHREECLKGMEAVGDEGPQQFQEPKLSFPADAEIPCFAQGLEVKHSKEYGYHVVTARDLNIGETVIIEEAYSIIPTTAQNYSHCANCFAREVNFIACKSCSAAMFCSPACHDIGHEKFHKFECGKPGVDAEWDVGRRLVMQIVIRAINLFPNVSELIDTIEKFNNRQPDSEENLNYVEPSIRAYMQLFGLCRNNAHTSIHQDFQFTFMTRLIHSEITSDPAYAPIFRSKNASRFLAHFILHHFYVLAANGVQTMSLSQGMFETILGANYGCIAEIVYAEGIYPNSSRLNHSCQPNIAHIFMGNKLVGKVLRPIKRGGQLFVSYL